jgi:hypothetical protein
MKEKEKALEIFNKHHYQICNDCGLSESESTICAAKNSAMIECDEIIYQLDFICGSKWKDLKNNTRSFTYEGKLRLKQQIKYWSDVRAEIVGLVV